jgi:SAM-dependent methyltransferase
MAAPARPARNDADYLLEDLESAQSWHFWFRNRERLVLWALRKFFPRATSVLDLGCGSGAMSEAVSASSSAVRALGCDCYLRSLVWARRHRPGLRLVSADARRLPARGGFDAILALDVIEHLDDDEEALREMRLALAPGGGLVLTVPQHAWLWSGVDDFSHHRRRYSRRELVEKVRRSGFEILRCTSFFAATLPAQLAARRRGSTRPFDPAAELRLPRTANRALHWLLQPELLLIRWGVRLPIGGSLLLVARTDGRAAIRGGSPSGPRRQ